MAAMGRVSTFVMHDLKNLLSNLALVAENAKEFLDDAEFREDLHHTLALTVAKMTTLISRLENLKGKHVLDPKDIDLKELAEETASLVTSGRVVVAGETAFAHADPEEIQKVMLNLVMNGIEAMDGPGTIRITVGLSGSAFFEVADEGCGMTEEFIREKLFRPFVTTKKKGFGIGLYQCKQIVEAHGGNLQVRSEPGSYTRFMVCLPSAVCPENFSLEQEA
jgi:putative PEP-CTERM system histidine kinase